MRINRVYVKDTLTIGKTIALDKAASNHLTRVLRLAVGTPLHLFNGDGLVYHSEIEAIQKNQVLVNLQSSSTSDTESPLNIHLFQGVSRGDKMDLTLQKGVELGISEFTPLISERCGVKLDPKRWKKKLEHWNKVIISACEQCGRNTIPKLNPVLSWNQIGQCLSKQSYFLDPHSSHSFKNLNAPAIENEIQIWVGPEGGFTDHEVSEVKSLGATPIFLGPRILRTETAALAAVSSINALWGDF